jgi:hypothetical protein
MNKPELLTMLRDIREYYHEAVDFQINGQSDAAASKLIDGDETLLPLIKAAEEGRLTFKGSTIPIEGQTVGARVKFLRELRKTSQHDLLKAMDRPKSHQAWLSRIEDGERNMSVEDLKKVAFFFDVSIDELVP